MMGGPIGTIGAGPGMPGPPAGPAVGMSGPGGQAPPGGEAALFGSARGGGALAPPGMMLNPAFVQWTQMAQAWRAEKERREQLFLAACVTLRHDVANGYKIDIEADSTVAADEQAEKAARTEFLQSILPLLQMLVPQAQQNPGAAPLVEALVMFGVRAFPAARGLEPTFEEAFRTLVQTPAPPPPPKGNTKPPMEIASEHQIAMGEQALDAQQNQIDQQKVQAQQQKNAVDLFEAYMKAQGAKAAADQEAQLRAAELTQQGQMLQSRAALDQARLTHFAARDATGLV